MANNYAFKSQIASIMEVLANTAVAEICKLIDNDYAVLRLEISQNQNENRMLKRKVQMMELKMARDRAERTIRDCLPNARSRGRTSVMDRNKGWRGGGHFVSRDRLLANQGESSWRGRRWLTDTPSKRTVGVQEPTVTELEGPVILIKEEVPEAVMPETAGTSWKRVVGPACDGMVLPTVTAEPLGSAAAAATGQHGSGHNVVEAVNADIGLPMNSMDEDQERQTDATSSFLLPGFKESDLAANDPLSTLGQTRELPMSSPVEHTVFSSAVKKESEEASSCSGLNRPSTSEGQWPAPVDVDWTANLASGQTQDHGSTSDTLEICVEDYLCFQSKSPTKRKSRTTQSVKTHLKKKRHKGPRASAPTSSMHLDIAAHWPEMVAMRGRCKYPGCTGIIRVACSKCKVHLCLTGQKNCFKSFHTELSFEN
ncbi:uncharacterized protein LOC134465189 isoform X6 [Engraulis encrasicolus]|uniref:uncharacterized protein LOC134465189 isoform X6 n=1 Tax=Engraulis encrasicolus TaxID=184585 RepID=UPI002FD3605F